MADTRPTKTTTTTKATAPQKKSDFRSAASRLLELAYPDRSSFAMAVGALCVSSLTNLILPTVLGMAVDRVSSSSGSSGGSSDSPPSTSAALRSIQNLKDTHFFLGCLAVFGVGSVASWFRTYTVGAITENIAMRLRCQIYASVLRQELSAHETSAAEPVTAVSSTEMSTEESENKERRSKKRNKKRGEEREKTKKGNNLQTFDIVQALSVESDVLAGSVTKLLTNFLRGCNSTLGGATMLLTLSPKLTVASLSVVPLIGVTAMISRMRTRKQAKLVSRELSLVNGRADERLKHLRTVKIFGREEHELNQYEIMVAKIKKMRTKVAMSEGIFMGALNMSATTSMLSVLCFGGWLVKRGEMTGGKLTAFMSYTIMLGAGSSMLAGIREKTVSAVATAENVFTVLDQRDANDASTAAALAAAAAASTAAASTAAASTAAASTDNDTADDAGSTLSAATFRGDIVFDGVTFCYPNSAMCDDGTKMKPILDALTMRIKSGGRTALVGPSGAGKSTVLSLLLRLYDVDAGNITIGGMNIKNMSKTILLENIGVVEQRPVLWNASIMENIRYGKLTATKEEIQKVIQASQLEEFVDSLPFGLETIVGEEGSVRMSGGQLARVAIARAMIKNPPILILDEATASLDSVSETKVREAIEKLMEGRTTLVVGHSVESIKGSKMVCVVENGKITEEGGMEFLLSKNQESRLQKFISRV